MHRAALLLASLACVGHGWRVLHSTGQLRNWPFANSQTSLKVLDTTPTLQSLAEVNQSNWLSGKGAFNPLKFLGLRPVYLAGRSQDTTGPRPMSVDGEIRLGHRIPTMSMSDELTPEPKPANYSDNDAKVALSNLFTRTDDDVVADPIDKLPLTSEVSVFGDVKCAKMVSASGIQYPANKEFTDLVPTSGRVAPFSLNDLQVELQDVFDSRVQTGLFRSPLTSFLYERGWRNGFRRAGFPGIRKEYKEVQAYFTPVATNGVVVDMSCGSGLMTRRLLKSGAYKRVLALDYSENMLRETLRRVREEKIPRDTLDVIRADVAALPLANGSIDAMHAGAAMHCWPKLEKGLAEIRNSLKPGGRFFATTFLQGAYGIVEPQQTGCGSFRFFESEAELKQLLVDAGFPRMGVTVRKEGRGCAIIKAEVAVMDGAPMDAPPGVE